MIAIVFNTENKKQIVNYLREQSVESLQHLVFSGMTRDVYLDLFGPYTMKYDPDEWMVSEKKQQQSIVAGYLLRELGWDDVLSDECVKSLYRMVLVGVHRLSAGRFTRLDMTSIIREYTTRQMHAHTLLNTQDVDDVLDLINDAHTLLLSYILAGGKDEEFFISQEFIQYYYDLATPEGKECIQDALDYMVYQIDRTVQGKPSIAYIVDESREDEIDYTLSVLQHEATRIADHFVTNKGVTQKEELLQ